MTISQLSDLADSEQTPLIVLKVGSSLLVKDGKPRRKWLVGLCAEIARLRASGQKVIVVCSGSVALGAARLGMESPKRRTLAEAQAAAAVGQIQLASLWSELLGNHELTAAQMLLTLFDLEDRRRYLNVSATIGRLLKAGAIPVINENDSVATKELRFGDNDRLAARVAQAVQASAIVLLSDIDGLYDRNPKEDGAVRLEQVEGITPEIHEMAAPDSGSGLGTGGMATKILAAEFAERAGMALAIINGTYEHPLMRAFENNIGTLFLPQRNDNARKAWLGARQKLEGHLVVDEGCVAALHNGGSLLAAGILSIEGSFNRGDPVEVLDQAGRVVAQGMVEYKSAEVDKIKGLRSDDMEPVLGYAPRSAVIHRDQLVML